VASAGPAEATKHKSMMQKIIYLVPFLLIVCGLACTEQSAPQEPPPPAAKEAPREQLQILRLRAGANPQLIKAGETTEIDVLVTNSAGRPLRNVNVEVAAGGGVFEATGKNVIVGPTDQTGQFRTIWRAPDPATSGYKLSFLARLEGMAEGREELLILID
jgi:hypothetical protein